MGSLSPAAQKVINSSVVGEQYPVGTILAALQNGVTGSVSNKSYGFGFAAAALNALIAKAGTVTPQQTTDATAGTATTVAVNATVQPVLWMPVNASGDAAPNIQSMTYSGGVATFTVASTVASQTYQILFV